MRRKELFMRVGAVALSASLAMSSPIAVLADESAIILESSVAEEVKRRVGLEHDRVHLDVSHTKMGKSIGSIKDAIGFIPNNSFNCNTEISTLEFGEYAVVLANAQKTLALLRECFNPSDAIRIYVISIIHFIQGFTYMTALEGNRIMSSRWRKSWFQILPVRLPSMGMSWAIVLLKKIFLHVKKQ